MISEHGTLDSSSHDNSTVHTVTMMEKYGRGVCSFVVEQSTWQDGSIALTLKSDGLEAKVVVHDNAITPLINALCRVKEWKPKPKEEENADS